MAMLRVAALLLDGVLFVAALLMVLVTMAESYPREAIGWLLFVLFLVVPVVNALTIILQARKSN